jgi:thiol peroxidase
MKDGKLKGLSARAIFVVDRSGTVVYKEIVKEVTQEPDYEAALDAIKEAR